MNPTIAVLGIIACAVVSAVGGSLFYFGVLPAKSKAAAKPAFTEHCVGKVMYLQFESSVVVKHRPDGKIWTCGGV